MSVTVEIKIPTKCTTVDPALFGGNMESTRQTFFGGLTAQLINNRKFFAVTDDRFEGWSCKGDVICGKDFSKSVCRSYYPLMNNAEIKQHSDILFASKQRKYEFHLWAESEKGAVITVEWGAAWRGDFTLAPSSDAQKLSAEFISNADTKGEFSISVKGCAALYCVSLMPADNISGMRKDVLDTLKKCGITALRFPGGCYAEVYPWKDGLLPVDFRNPIDSSMYDGNFLFRNTYGYDCHEIGTDEFMLLCRYIGAKPALTVPIINYDVKNAVDWVEYCNGDERTEYGLLRERRGIKEPYGVECLFVGNEVYYFDKELAADGNIAGEKEKAFINAIKAVDSSIKTVVGFCPNMPKWSTTSLKVCENAADIISHHYYFTNEFEDNFGKITKKDVPDAEKSFRESLDKTKELALKTSKKSWNISVDEWGYDWGNRGHNLSAVVDSIIFHFIINHADEYRIKKAFYFHPVNEGLVNVMSDKTEFDIMGEIWKMLKLHCGNTLCEVMCNSGDLSIVATKNNTHTFLTVVNLNIDKPQTVKFNVSGISEKRIHLIPEAVSTENNNFTLDKITDSIDAVTLAPGSVSLLVFRN